MEGGEAALPFVSLFYSSSSTYIWEDHAGITNIVKEKPALFAVGHHSVVAVSCAHTSHAFYDDLCVVVPT